MMQAVRANVEPSEEGDGRIGGVRRLGYRPRELARLYGLAPSTIYAAIYREELRVIRKGRAIIVLAEDVDRWLREGAA